MQDQPTATPFLHLRDLPGTVVSPRTEWNGRALNGTYLLEFTPEQPPIAARSGAPAVVLIPGAWDTQRGAFSKKLASRIFEETQAPAVYEVHYRYEGTDGYIEPNEVCEDFENLSTNSGRPLVIIILCGGCLMYLEALLRVVERGLNPSIAGVLVFGAAFPPYMKLSARVFRFVSTPFLSVFAKHIARVGHPYGPPNYDRLFAWWKSTRFKKRILEAAHGGGAGPPFAIPVRSYAFEKDFMTRKGFALFHAIFSIPTTGKEVPGSHNHLRFTPMADDEIIDFYREVSGSSSGSAATKISAS